VFINVDGGTTWKKEAIEGSPAPGADETAIHADTANEINQVSEKVAPEGDDLLLLEDSAGATWTKKKAKVSNFLNGGLSKGHASGAQLAFNTISTVDILAGELRSDDDTFDLIWASTLTADIAAAGAGSKANGLDAAPGTEAADTIYYLYVIGDSNAVNPVASLLSASATAPTLPSGYDRKRLVGAVLNDDGSDFVQFYASGEGRLRRIWYEHDVVTYLRVLNNGSSGTSPNMTQIDLSSFIPAGSQAVILTAEWDTVADDMYMVVAHGDASGQAKAQASLKFRQWGWTGTDKESGVPSIDCPVNSSRQIRYAVQTAANVDFTLYVAGYEMRI
jgi:hypothetical protein